MRSALAASILVLSLCAASAVVTYNQAGIPLG